MYRLTWCDRCRENINARSSAQRALRVEDLYCYLSHATSFVDCLGSLARAVDRVCCDPGIGGTRLPPFGARKTRRTSPWEFSPSLAKSRAAVEGWQTFCKQVRRLRNRVVHDTPVYVIRGRIPAPDMLDQYAGLAAIAEAVARRGDTLTGWLPLAATVSRLVDEQAAVANTWWRVSDAALNSLPRSAYLAFQRVGIKRAIGLNKRDFDAFFGG